MLDNLRRWHWCLIGIAFGLGFASIKLWAGIEEPKGTQQISPVQFEDILLRRYDPANEREVWKVANLKVAPQKDQPVGRKVIDTEVLRFDAQLVIRPPKPKPGEKRPNPGEEQPIKGTWFPFVMVMELPHKSRAQSVVGPDVDQMNVREYLDKLKAKVAADPVRYEKVEPIIYKYSWIDTPKGAYTIYGTAGFVAVGLIWPTVISLLSGGGLGFRRASGAKDDYDLSRFKGEKKKDQAKPVVTDAELERLAAMEAELEAKLAKGAKPRVVKDAEVVAPVPAVPVLKGGPLEVAAEVAKKAEATRKGFGADQGDYYPTEVHGKKKE